MNYSPEQIFNEWRSGMNFKSSIGAKGLYEQTKINERFFIGDQWYGAKCGNDRPLVRHNVIKRIGDYKMSVLLSGPIKIYYSAEGVPNTIEMKQKIKNTRRSIANGEALGELSYDEEISLVMSALNDYQSVTSERVKFESVAEQALRNAFISGTGIIYTYWDGDIPTGLYADDKRTVAIKGDIRCESLNIENVYFGDPYNPDLQSQPYIIIANRVTLDEAVREALKYNEVCPEIKPESDGKVTILTRLWKEYEGGNVRVMAQKVVANALIRDAFNIGVRIYPMAKFCWERRENSPYGDSEITYLIPNQIAINRMITSGVWSTMMGGMPTMIVNADVIDGEITNDPGQIIKVFGSGEDVNNAVRYVTPPDISDAFNGMVDPLIKNTLTQSGANNAALGDVNPDNTSAIKELRNAARLPLVVLESRYHAFLEEISRIWVEFWITQYGKRRIKIRDENGDWYFDFDADKYRTLLINAKAEVSLNNSNNEENTIKILDNLLSKGAITVAQYLKRLPRGVISNINELISETEVVRNDGN